jgi:hypothetical protein
MSAACYYSIIGENYCYCVNELVTNYGRGVNSYNKNLITLGESKLLSRNHFTILFNSNLLSWQLILIGRNGVTIDNIHYKIADQPITVSLPSHRSVAIKLGEIKLWFCPAERTATE